MHDDDIIHLLRLTLAPGVGPVRAAALIERFGSARAVLAAPASELELVKGIGRKLSAAITASAKESAALAQAEVERARAHGIKILGKGHPDYPALLGALPNAPILLYVRGAIDPHGPGRFPVAIVGSRHCTTYGLEQAERFGSILAQSGLMIVSGGARGIDTAAHRGALRAQGRTVVVLGCGLEHCYPAENQGLFDEVVARGGAVVSELPLGTPPSAENFPARNRIISGLSLGVLVIEAGAGSGALITARQALEEHGREVMALPGRVDSPASQGSLALLKEGGAALVTEPGDVIALLESPARHVHAGTHEARYQPGVNGTGEGGPGLFAPTTELSLPPLDDASLAILAAAEGSTLDEICARTALPVSQVRSQLTLLEIARRVIREGSRFRAAGGPSR